MKRQVTVSYSKFIKELTNEVNFMNSGGTTYRWETAELSLKVAKIIKNVNVFLNRERAYRAVSNLLSVEDEFRVRDVAKMLNVVLLDLHLKANQTDEINSRLAERARKRKPLNLVPVM